VAAHTICVCRRRLGRRRLLGSGADAQVGVIEERLVGPHGDVAAKGECGAHARLAVRQEPVGDGARLPAGEGEERRDATDAECDQVREVYRGVLWSSAALMNSYELINLLALDASLPTFELQG